MQNTIMQGKDLSICNLCINALIGAWRIVNETRLQKAIKQVPYGKIGPASDTKGLDGLVEIHIKNKLQIFDHESILVTEELGHEVKNLLPTTPDPNQQPTIVFCDPTDRTKFFIEFLQKILSSNPNGTIGELMKDIDCIPVWENIGGKPATITGPTTSVTCVRKGTIVFSVILNYITRMIFIAIPDNIYYIELPDYTDKNLRDINYHHIITRGHELTFPPSCDSCCTTDDYKRFVTFLGKSGYQENFNDSLTDLDLNMEKHLHHREPGGPARILYLSDLQNGYGPIGFIVGNGEKITEWISWLAFVKYARRKDISNDFPLKVIEIFIERPWTKDRILMAPPPYLSIFREENNRKFIDVHRLKDLDNPSKFRSMLVITTSDNDSIIDMLELYNHRNINLYF